MKPKNIIIGLSLAFTVTASQVYAQKCKYEYQKTDELTGKTSKAILYEVSDELTLRFKENAGAYSCDMLIYFKATSETVGFANPFVEKGDSIAFKLNTGEIICLYAEKQIKPSVQQKTFSVYFLYDSAFPISRDLLEKLSGSTVTYIRSYLDKKIYDGRLKEKSSKKLQETIKCILLN